MKRKTVSIALGLAGAVAGLSLTYHVQKKAREQAAIREMTAQLREFFASLGEIAVLYVNPDDPRDEATTGGVVMTDNRHYQFSYYQGDFVYEEVGA